MASASLHVELCPLKSCVKVSASSSKNVVLRGQRCHSDEVQPGVGGPLIQDDPWPYKQGKFRHREGAGLGLVLPEAQQAPDASGVA